MNAQVFYILSLQPHFLLHLKFLLLRCQQPCSQPL
jgi:hypothetical protein